MPLFRRPDGDLVVGESPVRIMMPYLMRGRNESCVYHEATYDITRTRAFLRTLNHQRTAERPATLFHYFLWSCGQALAERPGMNRFVSGGRLYQRKGMFLSFAAKKEIAEDAPLVTVKLPFFKEETFADCSRRIIESIEEGRHGPGRQVDKEVAFFTKFPGWALRGVMKLAGWLDAFNLMPAFMIDPDPMYTSLFVANLGSVGLDRTFHHLYEYGTAGMFAVLGTARKQATPARDGTTSMTDVIEVRWTLDERVNDGLYAGRSLALMRGLFEDPEKYATLGLANPDAALASNLRS